MACTCHRFTSLGLAVGREGLSFPEPGVGPRYAPSRSVAIEHIDVRLSLEPEARTFAGHARIRVRSLPGYAGRFAFDLAEVVVESVTDGSGVALDWRHDDEELVLRAATVPAEVVVKWRGQDPTRGLYFTGPEEWDPERQHMAWTQFQDEDGHFVLPCHDHPGVKHTWRISLDAPEGFTLLSNGRRVEEGERDGRAFAIFEQREPMPAYVFTAVAAELTIIEAEDSPVPVRYLVPVGEEEAVARSMGKTPLMIESFSRLVGVPYPWPRYDQVVVHDFIFGGMENVACTTMTDVLLVDEKGILDWDPDGLVAHELAHQWFGDLVTCQDWSQGWLNESWATFMEAVWWEVDRDEADATWYRWGALREYLHEHDTHYRRPIVDYRFKEPIDVFDRHLYQKGSCVLWTLRRTLGDEGFWAGVRRYLERHRTETVHTRHFQRALEETTGRNLDRFFEQWIHSPSHPQLDVRLGEEQGLVTVTVKQTQSGEGVPEVWHLGLRLAIVTEGGAERIIELPIAERERTWAIPVDGKVETVRVDPGLGVLAEIKLSGPEGWLKRLLYDRCPVLAVRAAKGLLDTGAVPAFGAVVGAMGAHPFYGVRASLASAVGGIGGDKAKAALMGALAAEQDPRVRRAIVDALGAFRHADVAERMLALLADEPATWQLHGAILSTLGKTRDPRARAALESQLDIPSWTLLVSQRALEALGALEDASVLPILLDRTARRHPDRVRAAAAAALGALGDKVESVRPKAVERLIEMLSEPGFRAQLLAIGALATLGDPKALPALDRVHRAAADGRMRRTAYEAKAVIRAGRTSEAGLGSLRSRIEQLAEENQKLRGRIEKLEKPLG